MASPFEELEFLYPFTPDALTVDSLGSWWFSARQVHLPVSHHRQLPTKTAGSMVAVTGFLLPQDVEKDRNMLVLSRKPGQEIIIGGRIKITVTRVSGSRVTLGIEAPDDVQILRAEIKDLVNQFGDASDEEDLRGSHVELQLS